MGDIVSVDHVTFPLDEVAEVRGQLADPHAEAGGAGGEAPGVVAVHIGVLVIAQAVDLIGDVLRDASGGIYTVDELAW